MLTAEQSEAFERALAEFVAKTLADASISLGGERLKYRDLAQWPFASQLELAQNIDPRGYADLLAMLKE